MDNGPSIVFEGHKNQGTDGSPEGSIGKTFTHKGVPLVNGPGVFFKGHKN
jgi:hypothetical protein